MIVWMWLACTGTESPTPPGDAAQDTAIEATGDTGAPASAYSEDWDGVQALFAEHCDSCHPSTNGIDLRERIDTYVVAGEPENSRLWAALTSTSAFAIMPPTGGLPAEDIAHVEAWILAGAVR